MKKMIAMLTVAALTSTAFAQFAGTSFEEPAAVGGQYVDTGDPAVDHPLADNPGEPIVNWTGTTELGFSSFYTNTRGDVGLTDGDFVGVTDFTGAVGAYTDGTQGFQISDPDGLMTTTIETVDISGFASVDISLDVFIADTGYEDEDRVRVWVMVDGNATDLLTLSGDDLEGMGTWMTLNTTVSGNSATLKFELDANAGSEALYVDNINFVPEPASLALLALGGLLAIRRR